MKRREFLKTTLPAATALQLGLPAEESRASKLSNEPTRYDVIIIGGTLAGCFAAYHAAKSGKRVLLVERRTFLATELTATLRPWLKRDGFDSLPGNLKELLLPEEELAEVGVPFAPERESELFGDEIPLFPGTLKKQTMQLLVDSGVQVLVATGVWCVLADQARSMAYGLGLANKSGLFLAQADRFVDARAQAPRRCFLRGRPVSYCVELMGVATEVPARVSVPKSLDVLGNRVIVHRGKRTSEHCYLEFSFNIESDHEHEARLRTESVCRYLIREHAGFKKARLMQMAWEPMALPFAGDEKDQEPYSNFENFGRLTSTTPNCTEVAIAWKAAQQLAARTLAPPNRAGVKFFLFGPRFMPLPLEDCTCTTVDELRFDYAIQRIDIPPNRIGETIKCDVVIAGGGTAGTMVAKGCHERGATTTTLEYLPELGGTSTIGRVTGYYAGYKDTHFFDQIEEGVKEQTRLTGRCTRGVARMLFYRKEIADAEGFLLTHNIVCGVLKEGRRVTGLVVEGGGRLFHVMGRVVVDATGDGDVAALAGADFEVGNRRMGCTQNYSQWDVNPGLASWKDSTTNRDYDIIWSHQLSEWQRGYQLSHSQASYYDFTPLLTVRESRRIIGDYQVTLRDIVLNKRFPDAICMATSDFDPHHFGDTAFTRAGCLLPHQVTAVAQIPYRSIVPRGLEALLVSAKAISQTHNAQQFTRMSFDIMTLGYVTGHIAAIIAEAGMTTRQFDPTELQNELRSKRILPEAQDGGRRSDDQQSTARYAEELRTGKPDSLLKMVMFNPRSALPVLQEAYRETAREDERLRFAKAMAWYGDRTGNTLITQEMNNLFRREQTVNALPKEYYREDKQTDYWTINQDIVLLALSGDASALPPILKIAEALDLNHPPVKQDTIYNQGRIDLALIPFYNRIINICFAIERLPSGEAVPALKRFLTDRFIKDQVSRRKNLAGNMVYGGILESRLAAAVARCGNKLGFELLVEYLSDIHPMLAEYARSELSSILGRDFGFDVRTWKNFVRNLKFPRDPAPCRRKLDEW